MQTVWFQNLPDQKARDEFKQILLNSTQLRNRLLQILDSKFEQIERRGFREEDYGTSGWETLQAFRNGKLAMLKEVADLFDFTDKEKDKA